MKVGIHKICGQYHRWRISEWPQITMVLPYSVVFYWLIQDLGFIYNCGPRQFLSLWLVIYVIQSWFSRWNGPLYQLVGSFHKSSTCRVDRVTVRRYFRMDSKRNLCGEILWISDQIFLYKVLWYVLYRKYRVRCVLSQPYTIGHFGVLNSSKPCTKDKNSTYGTGSSSKYRFMVTYTTCTNRLEMSVASL